MLTVHAGGGRTMLEAAVAGARSGAAFQRSADLAAIAIPRARALALPEIGDGDVFLCYLPLFHTFGRFLELLGCVFWGARYCFLPHTSVDALVEGMQRQRPTVFISVPKKWIQLYDNDYEMLGIMLNTLRSEFPVLHAFRGSSGDLLVLASTRPITPADSRRAVEVLETNDRVAASLSELGIRSIAGSVVCDGRGYGEDAASRSAGGCPGAGRPARRGGDDSGSAAPITARRPTR